MNGHAIANNDLAGLLIRPAVNFDKTFKTNTHHAIGATGVIFYSSAELSLTSTQQCRGKIITIKSGYRFTVKVKMNNFSGIVDLNIEPPLGKPIKLLT